uniref:Uncharacterized protein n=1 Tax=viral metagenome TaxID=1070528 RepID=A0A6H1ZLH5_9ZZZZ
MKLLKLVKGEPAYISIPEDCLLTTEYTSIQQQGKKLVLIRAL